MSKTTTTLLYIIQSELLNMGYNEFLSADGNQITVFDNNQRIMSIVTKYENPSIISACRNTIFYGIDFLTANRQRFERDFLNTFLNRPIKYQTFEAMRSSLVGYLSTNLEVITNIYQAELFIQGRTNSNSSGENVSETTGRNNNLFSDLPQNNTGIDLNRDGMDYATNTTISKSKSDSTGTSHNTSNSSSFNIDNLDKVYQFKKRLFDELDTLLFSQIF